MKEFIDIFFAKRALPQATEAQRAFLETLMIISRQGHLCLQVTDDEIFPDLQSAEVPFHPDLIREGASSLPSETRFVIREENRWYLERNWKFEKKVITHLKRLAEARPKIELDCVESEQDLQPEQKAALISAYSHTLSLISGGPGTGKSYVASQLVSQVLKQAPSDYRIVLAAPTGKAAAHLESKIPKDPRVRAGTLHMLLKIKQAMDLNGEGGYLGADLVIIDECSMIDVRLFAYLLASLESGTRIVLMGDEDQLPPVDSGSLFADLIHLKDVYAITHLTKCMRTDRLEIAALAAAVKRKDADAIAIDESEELNLSAYFIAPSYEMPQLDRLYQNCILSCMRQGPWGVDDLNRSLAEHFLAQGKKDQYFVAPILVTRNDYAQKIYNGQTGILVRRIGYEKEDKIIFPDRELPAALVIHYEYAYVLSVHKSQGSEYDHVLLLVPDGSEVFGREVIYTAVTRARQSIIIKGKKETLRQALARTSRKTSAYSFRQTAQT